MSDEYIEDLFSFSIRQSEEIPKKKMGKIKKVGYTTIAYKYKVKCSDETKKRIDECLYLCRLYYNSCIEERILRYDRIKHLRGSDEWKKAMSSLPNFYSQKKELPKIKEFDERFKKYPSNIFQNVAERVNRSYQNFFRGSGYPEFKSRKKYNSFTMSYSNGYHIDHIGSTKLRAIQTELFGNYDIIKPFVKITGIGTLKLLSFHERPIRGIINSVTVSQDKYGETYVSFSCDVIPSHHPKTGLQIGIDVGINRYLALSDGNFVENPKFIKEFESKRRLFNRALARKKKFSNKWRLNSTQIKNLSKKESMKRIDFQHKITSYLVLKYDTIVCEELQIKNMTKSASGTIEDPGTNVKAKSGLNKSLLDGAYYRFFQMLRYKCNLYGKTFIQVPPHNTSLTCSNCGYKDKGNRPSQETFECLKCGHKDNADTNASKNILKLGLDRLTK